MENSNEITNENVLKYIVIVPPISSGSFQPYGL